MHLHDVSRKTTKDHACVAWPIASTLFTLLGVFVSKFARVSSLFSLTFQPCLKEEINSTDSLSKGPQPSWITREIVVISQTVFAFYLSS